MPMNPQQRAAFAAFINTLDEQGMKEAYDLMRPRWEMLKAQKMASAASTLYPGCPVEWDGKFGHQTGKLLRINRTTASVLASTGMEWRVGLTLLRRRDAL